MKIFTSLLLITVGLFGCGASSPEKTAQIDYYKEGIKELKDGNIKAAIMDLNKKIAQKPKNIDAYLVLGKIYIRLKEWDRAIKYLNIASSLDPSNGNVFLALAKCYNFDGDTQEAINNVKKSAIIFKSKNDVKNYNKSLAILHTLINSNEEEIATIEK